MIRAAPPQIGLLGIDKSTPPQIDLLGATTRLNLTHLLRPQRQGDTISSRRSCTPPFFLGLNGRSSPWIQTGWSSSWPSHWIFPHSHSVHLQRMAAISSTLTVLLSRFHSCRLAEAYPGQGASHPGASQLVSQQGFSWTSRASSSLGPVSGSSLWT